MGDYEFLNVEISDGVASITLRRPPLNVLNIPMMHELNAALEGLAGDADLGAIVIRAEGKAFSAGVDIADHTEDKVEEMMSVFHGIFRKLAQTDALTIAVVQGAALGGGCELACFCDVVLASNRAKFGQPEIQVGVFPPVAASILPYQIGVRRALEINVLGELIDAAEAHRIGLVSGVYSSETFDSDVNAYLEKLKQLSRPVMRLAKRATTYAFKQQILAHLEQAEKLYMQDLMKLKDAHEGIAAFMEKRSPVWRHA